VIGLGWTSHSTVAPLLVNTSLRQAMRTKNRVGSLGCSAVMSESLSGGVPTVANVWRPALAVCSTPGAGGLEGNAMNFEIQVKM
jgi:hypothetical protein